MQKSSCCFCPSQVSTNKKCQPRVILRTFFLVITKLVAEKSHPGGVVVLRRRGCTSTLLLLHAGAQSVSNQLPKGETITSHCSVSRSHL